MAPATYSKRQWQLEEIVELHNVPDIAVTAVSCSETPKMVDPLSIVSNSLGIVSSTISGLVAVWNFIKICEEIKSAPENAQIFIRLLKQVTEDFDYAVTLRTTVQDRARNAQTLQDKWIYKVLRGTAEELHDFGRHVQMYDKDQVEEPPSSEQFKAKVRFVLKDADSLKLRREGLRAGHNRLLAAITTMHSMAPPVMSPAFGRHMSAPAGPLPLRRASRMPLVPDDGDDDDDEKARASVAEREAVLDTPASSPGPPAYCAFAPLSFGCRVSLASTEM